MKLTVKRIKAMRYEGENGSRDVRWDDEVSGFGVRLYQSGKKAFVLSYRIAGRKRLLTLGAFGVKTLDQARAAARRELAKVEDGGDPLEDRQKIARGETVRDLCRTYLDVHARPRKRSWRDDERRIQKYVLPAFGGLKVANVRRADVAALHARIGRRYPYTANRTAELLSKMFALAETWGFAPDGHSNPARGIVKFREVSRDRWITPAELPALARAIDEEANLYAGFALWLLLLTGLRKRELLRARWEDVDWERRELRIGETKAGRPHVVPLSRPALDLLARIPRMEKNSYIIAGHREGTPLVNLAKPWARIKAHATLALWEEDPRLAPVVGRLRDRLGRDPTMDEVRAATDEPLPTGVLDVRIHDLRRSVGSWLAQSGSPLRLIGEVLNHRDVATTSVYARFAEDHVRQALEEHGKRLMGVAGKLPSGEVVDLDEARKASST